eukprot:TRINITY_DN3636_c0_g1_i1.p2 TRINITY_DN3636_c0_g1~~TRINITY_DN3636_c0_g1_i1.p2  ORF type:complete len:62 (+),score=6.08 TRINITY_DN3636_c0_g1_i1:261-446(+)
MFEGGRCCVKRQFDKCAQHHFGQEGLAMAESVLKRLFQIKIESDSRKVSIQRIVLAGGEEH